MQRRDSPPRRRHRLQLDGSNRDDDACPCNSLPPSCPRALLPSFPPSSCSPSLSRSRRVHAWQDQGVQTNLARARLVPLERDRLIQVRAGARTNRVESHSRRHGRRVCEWWELRVARTAGIGGARDERKPERVAQPDPTIARAWPAGADLTAVRHGIACGSGRGAPTRCPSPSRIRRRGL